MDPELFRHARAALGFMPDEEGLALHDAGLAAAALGPLLEVGTYCGKSAIYLGAAARAGDTVLFEALRQRRSALAKEQRVAAYVVFADKTLIDMARRKPATAAEMAAVHGVGEAKLRQYGDIFLDVIRQYAAAQAA